MDDLDNAARGADRDTAQFEACARVALLQIRHPRAWAMLCGTEPPTGEPLSRALRQLHELRLFELEFLLHALHRDCVEQLDLDGLLHSLDLPENISFCHDPTKEPPEEAD